MAYSEFLVDRLKQHLQGKVAFECKKMMGGLIFMVRGKMCFGIDQDKNTKDDRLMVKVGKPSYEALLNRQGCREMDFTGKVMKGFLFVYPDGFDSDEQLTFWLEQALAYNQTISE